MTNLLRLHADVSRVLAAAGIADATDEAAAIIEAVSTRTGEASASSNEAGVMAAANARALGTPLEYITGRARFMGVTVFTDPGALIPRAETELLGNIASSLLPLPATQELCVIDMCCGSGNLACALALRHPGLRVWASDLTPAAVAVARKNTARLGIEDRVEVVEGDLFAPLLDHGLAGKIDMVVCNPPYISTGRLDRDRAELLSHEPREAFDGGPYGLSIFQRVIREAVPFLKQSAHLVFEVGAGQERQVEALFARSRSFTPAAIHNDANGVPRVVGARLL